MTLQNVPIKIPCAGPSENIHNIYTYLSIKALSQN